MDDTQQLDCTQALLCDQDEEDELDETHHLVAWLEVNGSQHQVFGGKNIIGRDPDGCKIVIPNKVLSKQHAVVEVRAGTHTLSDLGSCNKTRLGKMVLRPHVQYALQGGEKIRFGNVMATYAIKPEKCDDSGSETGSESMLPMMEDEEERSPSPVLSSRLHYSGSQNALQNGTDAKPVTSVFSQNSSILQAKGMSSSPSLDTPLSHLTDSLLQSSDVESSVVSASQSPTKKTALPSPSCTRRTDLEEYNSDASTDVEDNAPAQFYPNSPEKPALTSPVTSVPETPPHSSHKTIIADTPGCSSSNISIPETPAASYQSPSKMDTSLCSLSITSIPETQDCSSPSPCFPDTPITTGDTPAGVQKNDHPGQGPDNECSVFKKPLAISTVKASRSPNTPVRVGSSSKSSVATKSSESVSTRLFSAGSSDVVDLDAPTQVFTGSASSDIDLEVPTQVFNGDTSVDLDAPTQVFTGDTSVDLDAPTQVFTGDTNVDLDAPTQVFASSPPSDVDLDVPTQVFTGDTNIDLDAPTQVFTSDAPGDLDCHAPTQVFTSDAPVDIDSDAPTQVFTSDAPVDIDPDAPTQVFISNASGDIDPDVPTQVFTTDAPKSIDGVEDKLDAAVTLVSSSDTPEISGDESCRQKLAASGNVKDIVSKGSSQLSHSHESVTDDPPSSPTLLYDPVDSDVPTQLFSGTCSDVLRPSSSIMEAWGHLESAASLKTSTPFVGHTSKENLEESDAASDISKSLFNEEDETDSLHGEKETGVFDIMEKSHKDLKEEYHSDESTDIEENTLTDTTPQTTHKGEKTVLSLKNAAECYVNKKRSMSKMPQNQALEGDCEEVLQFPTTSSSPGKDESLLMLTGQNTPSSTRKRRKHRQVIDSEPCSLESSQEAVPIKVSLSDCTFVSEESNEGIHLASPCKKGPEQSDWLSDSESEEDAKNQSQKLFDLPSDTEDPTQKEENILSSINRKTTDTVDVVQKRKNVLPPPTTRKSTRLVSRKASTPQKNGKRFRAASSATPASSSSVPVSTAPKYNQIKMSVSSSLTPASIPSSVLAPAFLTAATTSTTPTSTTSAPTCVPVPNLTIAPMTRRQTRRGKTELVTSSSTTIPVQSPTCTRRGKRSTPSYGIHSTGTIFNTVTTPISSPRTTSDTTLTTISNSNIITASTVTTLQDKRRTRSQRVSVLSPLNTRGKETETFNESTASPQPSTSAATNSSNSSANTRSRRSKQATIPSVIKVKVEVKDEDVQMTPLTTIKQEKEEIETPIDEQIIIKTEPKDDLPQDNLHKDSGQCRRTRRKPMRYSPERDISLPGRRSTSSGSSGSIQKEKTGNASAVITESSETPKDVPVQQRRSQRVLTSVQTRKQEGATSVLNSIRVKEEQEDFSEEYSESPIPLSITQTTKADPPPKKSRQSRASTSRGASQAPSRATKKIKMEFITKEESDEGHPEDSQSRITQPKAKQIKMSDCKKEEATKRVSRNSLSQQKAKRIKQESSDSASSSHSSVSSRATRSNKDVELWSPSRRQRQASTKPRVLFTGYDDPADLKIVSDLGGRMVETPHDCTVLVATSVKRTCKLLSAIGMGRPIVNPNWLTMSKAAGNFVDPWQFLLKDHAAEEKYGFCLEDTIKSASNFLLFEGLSIYATPSVQPPPCQMRDIVECAGGDYLHAPPRKYAPQIRIISCPEDKRLWPSFKSLGIPILGVEFILTGLLRHELLLEEFVLN